MNEVMRWVYTILVIWALYLLGDVLNRYHTADLTMVQPLKVGVLHEQE